MAEEQIGTVSDFFARPVVAAIELTGELKVGDKIHVKGHTTDIETESTTKPATQRKVQATLR